MFIHQHRICCDNISLFLVYVYARATFNAVTATGGGAGGGASFVVKDKHMLGVNAGANFGIGQPVSGEVPLRYGVKLQLKK